MTSTQRIRQLERQVNVLRGQMSALFDRTRYIFHLHEVSENNKPRTKEELRTKWSRVKKISELTEWDNDQVNEVVEFCWFLGQREMKWLDEMTGVQYGWLALFKLLDLMRLKAIAAPDFQTNYLQPLAEARIRGALKNMEYAAHVYLLRHAPELLDAIDSYIYGYIDNLTPAFSSEVP